MTPEWIKAIWLRVRALVKRRQLDRDLREEIGFHLAMRQEKYEASGLAQPDAALAARRQFGNLTGFREACREMRTFIWLETLAQDLRYGLRQLRRNPGFTAVAIITLALGIGANTAIFSVVDGVLLAPLPYSHADRLVVMWESIPRYTYVNTDSYPNFRDWQHDAHSFREMAAWHARGDDLSSPGAPEHLDGNEITSGFFATLGVKLALGRGFIPQEDQPGGTRVAIISNSLWRERFNASPHVLGKIVTLDGVDYSVVGVLPRGFQFFGHPDVYMPLGQSSRPDLYSRGDHAGIGVVALLKWGATLEQAQAEMKTIQHHLDQLYPDADRGV